MHYPYGQAWLRWLVQAVVVLTYSLHCYQSSTKESEHNKQEEEPNVVIDQQAQEQQVQENSDKRKVLHQAIRQLWSSVHKRVVAKTLQLQNQGKDIISLSKQLLRVLKAACLRESYLVSLVGLYMCGLTAVNLLNTGYSMFFFLFLFCAVANIDLATLQ